MAYKLMVRVINIGAKTKDELLVMCDVYYAAGRITAEQYQALVDLVEEKYPSEETENDTE